MKRTATATLICAALAISAALLPGTAAAAGAPTAPVTSPIGTVTEFTTGLTASNGPQGMAIGADGNLWFTESGSKVGRVTPAGVITEFSTGITPFSNPWAMTSAPDGNLWFVEQSGNRIGRVTTAGVITEFSAGITANAGLNGIAAGPDGNLWFTETNADRIGRITPAGVVTEFYNCCGSNPWGIAAGPDGALWFTEQGIGVDRIGRITTDGVVTEYGGLTAGSRPIYITAGSDGAMWFTEYQGNRIGRISINGSTVTEYPTGVVGQAPLFITPGTDGTLWFTDDMHAKVGRITTAGAITEFSTGITNAGTTQIVLGPDGAMWFTEFMGTGAIAEISTGLASLPSGNTLWAYANGTGTPAGCPAIPGSPTVGCSLGEALNQAVAGDTIYLGTDRGNGYVGNWAVTTAGTSAVAPLTIAAAPGVTPVLNGNRGVTDANCTTIDCTNSVLSLTAGVYLNLKGTTVTGAGTGAGAGAAAIVNSGGTLNISYGSFYSNLNTGIWNTAGGSLTVADSRFAGNIGGDGAAIDNADGSTGAATIVRTTFSGNVSNNVGGAIDNADNGGIGSLTVTDSTFVANAVSGGYDGGAIGNGLDNGNGTLTVSGSTFDYNTADNNGGAIVTGTWGGTGTVQISTSTFVGNYAYSHGGAIQFGTGTNQIWASTFSANSDANGAQLDIGGTLNSAANVFSNGLCTGTWADAGYSVTSDASCLGGSPSAHSVVAPTLAGTLGILTNNAGPTLTILPASGSPVFGMIPSATSVSLGGSPVQLCGTTDQRGVVSPAATACSAGSVQAELANLNAPTSITASPRNHSAVVGWIAPSNTGGAAILGYTVTASPKVAGVDRTCTTTAATTCTVSGLTNGVAYRFTVTDRNSSGLSPASAASAATIAGPTGVPRSLVAVFPLAKKVTITWSAPALPVGIGTITGYQVRWSSNGGVTWSAWISTGLTRRASRIGLVKGHAYRVQVRALNVSGAGLAATKLFTQTK